MDQPHVTPDPTSLEVRSLQAQHTHDMEALSQAADLITTQAALIARLRLDQAALILDANREKRR